MGEHCVEDVRLLGEHEFVALELSVVADEDHVRVLHVIEVGVSPQNAEMFSLTT